MTARHWIDSLIVFPTPVGMARDYTFDPTYGKGFPHARGDGPLGGAQSANNLKFSPRPWGWPAGSASIDMHDTVFPTPVGMARIGVV